jgi:hypothetical protein
LEDEFATEESNWRGEFVPEVVRILTKSVGGSEFVSRGG